MDPERRVRTLRDKLDRDDRGGCPRDRDALLEFEDTMALLSSEYSAYRREKLLRHCTRISEHADTDIAAVIDDEAAAKTVVRWINRQYDNPETNRDYRVALRGFAKHLTDGDDIPDSVSWVPASTPSNYQPTPDPADMLRWEDDVKPMIDAATNDRDAALIAVAFDAGARSGELQELTVGDISDGDYGLRLRVDGKTGARTVTLVPSEHYLSQWLGSHPDSGDSDAPLWSKLGTADSLSYRRFRDIFKEVADRAEVDKPTTPTNFRKSNASWLARQGANAALIEDRQGRSRNSEAVSRYVSRFGEGDEARQYAALNGIEVDESGNEKLAPVECRRCGHETPHDEPMCVHCGAPVDPTAAATAESVKSSLREAMARSDDPDERQGLLKTLEKIDSDPEVAVRVVEEAIQHQ